MNDDELKTLPQSALDMLNTLTNRLSESIASILGIPSHKLSDKRESVHEAALRAEVRGNPPSFTQYSFYFEYNKKRVIYDDLPNEGVSLFENRLLLSDILSEGAHINRRGKNIWRVGEQLGTILGTMFVPKSYATRGSYEYTVDYSLPDRTAICDLTFEEFVSQA